MKSVKWMFLCGLLAGVMTACEKHPADQVPGSHGPEHDGGTEQPAGPHREHKDAAGQGHEVPQVPQYFPKTE